MYYNFRTNFDDYKGFKVSDNVQINILQFADDTILVGEDIRANLCGV
jgi:hypothetical protein